LLAEGRKPSGFAALPNGWRPMAHTLTTLAPQSDFEAACFGKVGLLAETEGRFG
jgi:hypothetical protein